MLAAYGVISAYAFGLLMNLSGWPFALGIAVPGHEGSLDFVAGAPLAENLQRFAVYTLLTSTGSFDTGRAITTAVAIVVLGPAVLTTLRRASRRALITPTNEGCQRRVNLPSAVFTPATRMRYFVPFATRNDTASSSAALSLTATLCSFVIFLPA